MHAIVVTFDRLPASFVGCCGHEWIETPHLDRLASQAELYCNHLAEIPASAGPNHPWWTGRCEYFDPPVESSLFEQLAQLGVQCRLISERTDGLPVAEGLDRETITGQDGLDVDHAAVPFARLVSRAIELLPQFNADDRPQLLWLHSRGVPEPWLPPEFFAGLYLDELEDEPDDSPLDLTAPNAESSDADSSDETVLPAEPSRGRLMADAVLNELRNDPGLVDLLLTDAVNRSSADDEFDPDSDSGGADSAASSLETSALGATGGAISRFVFAGYVSLLDHWIGKLLEAVGDQPVCLIISAADGQDIGERQEFRMASQGRGSSSNWLAELTDSRLRTPLIIRRPDVEVRGVRHLDRVQPASIAASLWQLLTEAPLPEEFTAPPLPAVNSKMSAPASTDDTPEENCSAWHAGGDGSLGISQGPWFLAVRDRQTLEHLTAAESLHDELHADSVQLFEHPDDLYKVHDVSKQHPDVVEQLLRILAQRLHTTRH